LKASAIIVVQKQHVLHAFANARFCSKSHIIAISGGNEGIPLSVIRLVRNWSKINRIPIGLLANEDTSGIRLFGLLLTGDLTLSTTDTRWFPQIHWLDFVSCLPSENSHVQLPLGQLEKEELLLFKRDPTYFDSSAGPILDRIVKRGSKIELEAMALLGLKRRTVLLQQLVDNFLNQVVNIRKLRRSSVHRNLTPR